MKLWTAHLLSLEGYYASDVYVVASERQHALTKLLEGVTTYVDKTEPWCSVPGIDAVVGDEDWNNDRHEFLQKVLREAVEKLIEVPSGAIINVKI